jgi:hypothetical protein
MNKRGGNEFTESDPETLSTNDKVTDGHGRHTR